MTITRRAALQVLGMAGATVALPRRLRGSRAMRASPDDKAILYDSTRCIGCRQCAVGCAEANGWDPALALSEDPKLTYASLTVVRRYAYDGGDLFRKVQCMHCVEPACVSACMLGAMHKDADGAVVWNGDLCVGCRYCEIACPFNTPRFEWDTPLPSLQKCQMCPERRAQGLAPACVEQCRRGALTYGSREEMLAEAHRRIDARPTFYNPKVYGETDGGGTAVLYLAPADASFADLHLPDLGEESVAQLPETIQHTLYRGFAAPMALLAVLGAVVRRNTTKLRAEEAAHHATERSEPVGGRIFTSPFFVLASLVVVGVVAVLVAVRRGPRGDDQPERRLPDGAVDRLRRGHGHGPGLRRLRDGAPGLRGEPGPLPPPGARRPGDQRVRLHAGRRERPHRHRKGVELLQDPLLLLGVELQLDPPRGRAVHHAVHAGPVDRGVPDDPRALEGQRGRGSQEAGVDPLAERSSG